MHFFKKKLTTNRLKYTPYFISLIWKKKNNFFTAKIFICSSLIHGCQNSIQIHKKLCTNELDIHWIHLNKETNHIRITSNHIVFDNLVQTWCYNAYWWPIVQYASADVVLFVNKSCFVISSIRSAGENKNVFLPRLLPPPTKPCFLLSFPSSPLLYSIFKPAPPFIHIPHMSNNHDILHWTW